jgi:hypothetical protein|tara:strand:- start:418 stop:747 length:330 start_codon:yes stop_codon:yes gene_type:complete
MEKQIIDIDFGDNIICIGQIRKDLGHELQVAILEHIGDGLWDFDEELECIPRESVSGFYDTVDLEKTGLYERTITGLYEVIDASDTEYVLPSDDDTEDSGSEVSLEDEF